MEFETIWQRIVSNQGNTFVLKRGAEFTYAVVHGCVLPNRTNRQLPKSQFQLAWGRLPLAGPGELQDLQGPSYLYAILVDSRIAQAGATAW